VLCNNCNVEFEPTCNAQKVCSPCATLKHSWTTWSLDYTRRLKRLSHMAKNRAANKNLPFDIDGEYLIKLWHESEGCCALTGRVFDLNSWGTKGQVNPDAPSVDRIVPSLGYVRGNVRLITYHMNISLSDFGTEIFEQLLKSYREFN